MDFSYHRVLFHRYLLQAKSSVDSYKKHKEREGVLFKIYFDEESWGYADCHPWIELGDLSVDRQIECLRRRHLTSILKQSLFFAQAEALARSSKQSIFTTTHFPDCQLLITSKENFSENLKLANQLGFKTVKLKGDSHIWENERVFREAADLGLRLRVDFNSNQTYMQTIHGIQKIQGFLPNIDFLEDPFPFDRASWTTVQKDYSLPLAADQWAEKAYGDSQAAQYIVVKPAAQMLDRILPLCLPQKIIVTSYLDHPIGQLGALWTLEKLPGLWGEAMGLCTHFSYEETSFSNALSVKNGKLIPPIGIGWGLDKQLEALDWHEL